MKITVLIFSLVFLINIELSAQEIAKKDLLGTEWFIDNSDNTFEMFTTNVNIGDSIILIKRIHTNVLSDSTLFGLQEYTVLGHNNYANIEFRAKSSLFYYLTTKENPFHTLVGQMPLWQWKIKSRKKIKLYQDGELEMTLKLLIKEVQNFQPDGSALKTKRLIFVRID